MNLRLVRQGPDPRLTFNSLATIISIIQGFYYNKTKLQGKDRILRQEAQTQSKLLRKIRVFKR